MNIRENAVSVTAKKIAYRQSKDGMVISFVLHPQEVPDKLATDQIGTSYMLALVEIDDATGQPKGDSKPSDGDGHPVDSDVSSEARRSQSPTEGGARKHVTNDKPSTSWHQLSPAQQAGILCGDESFQRFVSERWSMTLEKSGGDFAKVVRWLCDVDSRREILPGTNGAKAWTEIVESYRAWQREPEFVG